MKYGGEGRQKQGQLDYLCLSKSAGNVTKEPLKFMVGLEQYVVTEHPVQ